MNLGAHFRARQLFEIDRYAEALQEYAKVVQDDPDDASAISMMALCELRLGRKKEALKTAQRAVGMQPENDMSHYVVALVYSELKNTKQAHAAIDEALRYDPEDSDYLTTKGWICAQGGDWRKAGQFAKTALESDPEHEGAQGLLAHAVTLTGDIELAREIGAKALHENPDSAEAHCANGFIFLRQGRHRDAAAHFREALRLEPDSENARDGMKIALKSVFPVYRWYVQGQMWLAGQGKAVRTIVIIAVLLIPRVLRATARANPGIAPFLYAIAIPFSLFIWFTWFGDSLLNVLLRFHPLGRYLLHRHEKVESAFFIGLLGMAVVGLLLVAVNTDRGLAIAGLSLFGVLLVGFSTNIESNMKLRAVLVWSLGTLFLGGLAVASFLAVTVPPAPIEADA